MASGLDRIVRTVFDLAIPEQHVNLESLGSALEAKLSFFEVEDIPQADSRLGPLAVDLEPYSISGVLKPVPNSTSHLEIESHSNFSSARATTCVYRGKWMYEVTLGTPGIQQLGWATLNCKFTNEEGVGDAPDSFAYDGRRVKKWNISDSKYGQPWVAGDVIGCYIDLDSGKISFSRNGQDLGVAFSNVRYKLPGLAYFPAVSLSHGERCFINFGALPLVYPAEGFQPMQTAPPSSEMNKTSYLLECLHRLLPFLAPTDGSEALSEDDGIILSAIIFQHLAPLLTSEYLTVAFFVPFLLDLYDLHNQTWLRKTVEMILVCLEDWELSTIFSHLFSFLALKCRTSPLVLTSDTSETSTSTSCANSAVPHLKLSLELLNHSTVKEIVLSIPAMERWLEAFFTTKQLSNIDLGAIFQAIHNTELKGAEPLEKETELLFSQWIADRFVEHHSLIQELCKIFLSQQDNSARTFFRGWLRNLLRRNQGAGRNIQPPGLSETGTLLNIFFNTILAIQPALEGSDFSNFTSWMFCTDVPLPYFEFPRLGGSVKHLQKELPVPAEQFEQMVAASKEVKLEWELIDSLAILFVLGPFYRIKLALQHVQARSQTAILGAEIADRIRRFPNKPEYAEHMRRLKEEEEELMRLCAAHRASLYAPEWKIKAMLIFMEYMVDILTVVSSQKTLFSYVPEAYLETLFEIFNALRRSTEPNVLLLPENERVVSKVMSFLVLHCSDSRIINPDQRELLLQTLNLLLQNADFVKLFETNTVAQSHLIKTVLSLFDNRFWISITNILLRFWKGHGFGQSAKLRASGSTVFQESLRRVCKDDPELFGVFLNRLFDNLNSVVTEFIVPLREIQSSLLKHLFDSQFVKKCNMLFELSVTLTRILEILTIEVPEIFLDKEMNSMRLAEFLVSLLSRTTVGKDAQGFENVLNIKILGLEKISRVAILSPIVGIVTNLFKEEQEHPNVHPYGFLKSLVNHPAFSYATFEYLEKYSWDQLPSDAHQDQLTLLPGFLQQLRAEEEAQKQKESEVSQGASAEDDDENICAICYTLPNEVRFSPCGHVSCHRCVERHLLSHTRCFFCNADIKGVVKLPPADATPDSSSSSSNSNSTPTSETPMAIDPASPR